MFMYNDDKSLIEWQNKQARSHFEKSDIFLSFINNNYDFVPQINGTFLMKNYNSLKYVFGNFVDFIGVPSRGNDNVFDYINILIKLYDSCKGYRRKIFGDPEIISILREIVITKNINIFSKINNNSGYLFYDYTKIHGHTIAVYSISSLIYRLASNYIYYLTKNNNYTYISVRECDIVSCNYVFGQILNVVENNSEQVRSNEKPINIALKQDNTCLSWPSTNDLLCSTCGRYSENLWGSFKSCLDCHRKKICSVCCSDVAIRISTLDNLPKCVKHYIC